MKYWKWLCALLITLSISSATQAQEIAPPYQWWCDTILILTGTLGKTFALLLVISGFAARLFRKMAWKRALIYTGICVLAVVGCIILLPVIDYLDPKIPIIRSAWDELPLALSIMVLIGIGFALLVRRVRWIGLIVPVAVVLIFGTVSIMLSFVDTGNACTGGGIMTK